MSLSLPRDLDASTPLPGSLSRRPTATRESTRAGAFLQHVHVFRALAIIMIVAQHVDPHLDWSRQPVLGAWTGAVMNSATILFIFIAGYLFQHLSGSFAYGKYLRRKATTIVLPYLLLSIPALVIFTQWVPRTDMWPWFEDLGTWEKVGIFLVTGKHLATFWFIPMIVLYYLASPLFVAMDRRAPWMYWAIVPLALLSAWIGRDGPSMILQKALYLLPGFLLGMACSRWREASDRLIVQNAPWLVMLVAIGLLGAVNEWDTPPHWQWVAKMPMALLLLAALKRWSGVFGTSLNSVASLSLGIYFIHAYVISGAKWLLMYFALGEAYKGEGSTPLTASMPTFLVLTALTLLVSLAVLWLAKRVLGKRSHLLVGV